MIEEKKQSFVVKDRRCVDEEKPVEDSTSNDNAEQTNTAADSEGGVSGDNKKEQQEPFMSEVNFVNFIISMSTTAMFHFGMFPDPVTKQVTKNLPAAKQVIDILGMLQEKTKGNLSTEEASILEESLYSLRIYFVQIKEKGE